MATMMLAPATGTGQTCSYGCCGGRHDHKSVKAARRYVRRVERQNIRRAVERDEA